MAKRVATAVTLSAVGVTILFFSHTLVGSILFLLLVNLIVAGGLYEFYTIVEKKGSTSLMGFGMVAGVVYCTISFFTSNTPVFDRPLHPDVFNACLVAIIIGFFVTHLLRRDGSSVIYNFGGTIAGMFYVAWLLAFGVKINYFPEIQRQGIWYVFMLVAIAKGGDAVAYFIGYRFGKIRLCPKISPHKTVEGSIGHLLTGVAIAAIFKLTVFEEMTLVQFLVVGVSLSIMGQFGDLTESLLKRDAQVKDSGKQFLELGGILDLFDSMVFALPLLYYLMRFWLLQNG